MRRWLAFDVGCIECGESSSVIGVFLTKAAAQAACDDAEGKQAKDWNGQHSMEVFEIEIPPASDAVDPHAADTGTPTPRVGES